MFKIKKAQGLSMNVIIIAVLALLVLVILSVVFTGRMRTTTNTLDSCDASNGVCILDDPSIYNNPDYEGNDKYYCGGTYDKITNHDCPTNQVCCIHGK